VASLYPNFDQLETMENGKCDLAFTPAQCSLYKMGMRAIRRAEECLQLSSQYDGLLQMINKDGNATEADCSDLNARYALGIRNKCCVHMWSAGCEFTAVRGTGHVTASICRQYKPPMKGPQTVCHYAHARFDPVEQVYSGTETVQNRASTNYVQCTKWENIHHLATVVNSQAMNMYDRAGGSDSSEDASKGKSGYGYGYGEIEPGSPANHGGHRTHLSFRQHGGISRLRRFKSRRAKRRSRLRQRLGRPAFTDVRQQHKQGSTLRESPDESLEPDFTVLSADDEAETSFMQYETSISVVTKAKKEVECSFCDTSIARRSLVLGDDDSGCKSGAARVCRTKKVLRCEHVCFLIGERGRALLGEHKWPQAFDKTYCPVGKVMGVEKDTFDSPFSDTTLNVTTDSTIFSRTDEPVGAPVTLTNLTARMQHLSKDVQMRILSENFESEDPDLQLCCFPGCVLPKYTETGALFPWYWNDENGKAGLGYNSHPLALQEAASIAAAHTF